MKQHKEDLFTMKTRTPPVWERIVVHSNEQVDNKKSTIESWAYGSNKREWIRNQ